MKAYKNKKIPGAKIRRLIFKDVSHIAEFKQKEQLILVSCRLFDQMTYNEFGGRNYTLLVNSSPACHFLLSRKANCWRLDGSRDYKEYIDEHILVKNLIKPLYYHNNDAESIAAKAFLNILFNDSKERFFLAASEFAPETPKYIIS